MNPLSSEMCKNALTTPAFGLPLVEGFAVVAWGIWIVFATALAAAIGQTAFLVRIDTKK